MGLFCLSLVNTPEAQLKSALGNLKLFKGMLEGYEGICDKHGNHMPDYLIGFAETQIKDALKYLSSNQPD